MIDCRQENSIRCKMASYSWTKYIIFFILYEARRILQNTIHYDSRRTKGTIEVLTILRKKGFYSCKYLTEGKLSENSYNLGRMKRKDTFVICTYVLEISIGGFNC